MKFIDIDEVTQARIKRAIRSRRFTLAPQTRIQSVNERLVARFMKTAFGLDEYLITDESRLSDFSTEAADIGRIQQRFGLSVRRADHLVDVLERISRKKTPGQR